MQSKQSQIKRDHFSLGKANFTIHGQSIYSISSKKSQLQLQSATDFIFSFPGLFERPFAKPLKIIICDWSKFAVELSCRAKVLPDITYRITTNGWWSCPAIVFGDSLKSNFSFVLLYWLMWVFICESIGFYIEAALLSWWNCDEICHFNFDESPSHFNYKISERIYNHKFNYKLIWLTKEYLFYFSHFPNWNSI